MRSRLLVWLAALALVATAGFVAGCGDDDDDGGSEISSVDDLSGKIVGAQDATTGETYAQEETEAAEVRGFPEGPDAVSALKTGQVDAVIIDQPVAKDAVEEGGVEIVEQIETNELYGFPMAKENTGLQDAVNGALTEMKEDGTLADLYQQYFAIEPPASVTDVTGGDVNATPELIEDGQLLVGTDTPFPPFEIGQPPDISGFDIEVVRAIAERLGLEVTFQDTSFDTLFRDTASGQFDLGAAASTITPEREKTVTFSNPYYEAQQALVVASG
jgi:polar amino acid transport system substrate-binding protein